MKKLLFIINPKAGVKKNKHFVDDALRFLKKRDIRLELSIQRREQMEHA